MMPAAIRKGVNHVAFFFRDKIFWLISLMSKETCSGEIDSNPSSASARNGSCKAFFSKACISTDVSSPFLYFSISPSRSVIFSHANFQVSFSILNKTFHLIQIKTRYSCYFLVTHFLQEKQFNAMFLLIYQLLNAFLQFTKIPFQL